MAYLIKIMTGDLRIGLLEGLIIDAIASAFDTSHHDVQNTPHGKRFASHMAR